MNDKRPEQRLRSWWWHRQGLDGTMRGRPPAAILGASGWARSVGGAGPYLTLFSRGGVSRQAADAAAATRSIHELPSARGCTYVLPAEDFALGLQVGAPFAAAPMKLATKLGVTEKEIAKLCDAVRRVLADGPLDPEAIRAATGKASRSLGEAGKKKGMTTTLPLALGRLQASGEIRRVPTDGRLDQQRYRYVAWSPNPIVGHELSIEAAHVQLARRYFRWIGPATIDEFRWFSGLGVKAAKAAVSAIDLVPAFDGSDRLMFADDREALRAFEPPTVPQYALLSSIDALFLLRRDLALLIDDADRDRSVLADRSRATLGSLADLPSHAIVDRGRIIGLWEFDPSAGTIAWTAFVDGGAALAEAIARTEAFVRDELGDARAFSLDSPQSRAPRIAALAAAKPSRGRPRAASASRSRRA